VRAVEMMKLTARGYHRGLRDARTIADLDGAENTNKIHISEAASFRQKRQMLKNFQVRFESKMIVL
jgi:magnesium chelatase family protein|tara:strand:- start:127216 stop:127413 length:198 start_codon:yes stop_codon:yes gene_type:complete